MKYVATLIIWINPAAWFAAYSDWTVTQHRRYIRRLRNYSTCGRMSDSTIY